MWSKINLNRQSQKKKNLEELKIKLMETNKKDNKKRKKQQNGNSRVSQDLH